MRLCQTLACDGTTCTSHKSTNDELVLNKPITKTVTFDEMSGEGRGQYVFVSGAISGIVEGVSIQPLEMLKTRFQINTGEHLKFIPTIREIIKEGGLRQLYRGGLPEITGRTPCIHAPVCCSMPCD